MIHQMVRNYIFQYNLKNDKKMLQDTEISQDFLIRIEDFTQLNYFV